MPAWAAACHNHATNTGQGPHADMDDWSKLKLKADAGTLTTTELRHVVQRLNERAKTWRDDLEATFETASLISIVGSAGVTEHAGLVSQFLAVPNSWIASSAIVALCYDFGLQNACAGYLFEFLKGVPWDDDNELRDTAIRAAGKVLRTSEDPGLANLLIQIAESTEDVHSRRIAVEAIGDAAGLSPSEWIAAGAWFEAHGQLPDRHALGYSTARTNARRRESPVPTKCQRLIGLRVSSNGEFSSQRSGPTARRTFRANTPTPCRSRQSRPARAQAR